MTILFHTRSTATCHLMIFAIMVAWSTLGCSGSRATPDRLADPERLSATNWEAAREDPLLTRLKEEEARRLHALSEVRREIDARAISSDCDAIVDASARASLGARASWALGWCALRTSRWDEVLSNTPRAIAFFQVSQQHRRLIETHIMSALAAHHTQDWSTREHHRARAEVLLAAFDEPLPAPLTDRFAGDLAYLLARSRHMGIDISPREDAAPLDPARLFELARYEYAATHNIRAVPHVFRARAIWALDAGELGEAASALASALAIDRAEAIEGGLLEDMVLFSMVAQEAGAEDWADASLDWLFTHDEGDLVLREIKSEVLPTERAQLESLAIHHDGRRRILRAVRAVRKDPHTALKPPAAMLALFKDLEDLDILRGGGWEIAYEVGSIFAEVGDATQARRYLHHAVREVERMRRNIPDLARRQAFFQDKRDLYLALMHSYIGIDTARLTQQDYRAALDLAAGIKARGMLDLLEGHTPASASARVVAGAVSPGTLHEQSLDQAAGVLASLASDWSRQSAEQRATVVSRRSELTLSRGSILLEYVLGERSGYVWIIKPDGKIAMRKIAGRRELTPLLAAFRETLVDHDYDAADYARHRELAERLHVELLGPLEDLIVGASEIIIAPDDVLHELAFEALARPSTDAIPDYLIRQHTLRYVPSATVFARLQSRPGTSSRRALLVGAPTLEQSALDLLSMTRRIPNTGVLSLSTIFPELPGSARELSNITRALVSKGISPERRSRGEATEAHLRREGEQEYRILHIAAHGVSDAPRWREQAQDLSVSQPALLLARSDDDPDDGIWKLDEILAARAAARLVVLSGCTTGRGWRTLGDGAYGLAGAFLSNGSEAVVASLWSVSDHATTSLMSRMYRHLDPSANNASGALRRAQSEILSTPHRGEPYTPPFYWAAFRVIGI